MTTIAHIESAADIIAEHKGAIGGALDELVVLCEAARRDGYHVEFAVQLNQFGMYVASPVFLVKRF